MAIEDIAVYEALFKEGLRRTVSEEDPAELHRWLSAQVNRIGGGKDEESLLVWAESFVYYENLEEKRAANTATPEAERRMLDWPWTSWNKVIDPLEPGMLTVVTAGDGQGKTTYAECIAEHWAKQRNKVIFVHYELNWSLMLDRRACRHTHIPRRDLQRGTLTPEQWQLLREMRERLLFWEGNIAYLHSPGWSMEQTILSLHKMAYEQKCDAVVIDYLEKAAASRRQLQMFGANTFQREADNVEQLKSFAEVSGIPILMLAQMSKSGKQTKATEIDRMDMRGAGEKSEKANLVVLLAREQTKNGYSNEVDVIVDKNTMGPTAKFKQVMIPEYFDVRDNAEKIEEPRSRWKD